ncbi:MAG: DUF3822 family protein [Bacteroidales bacterium]|nr:DUF3822 family protein [Bacteroidales bacterium]
MSDENPVIRYYDSSLNHSYSEDYILSIRILPDGFSFAVLNKSTNKYIALESYTYTHKSRRGQVFVSASYLSWLNKILGKQPLLHQHFSEIVILVGDTPFTLIPPALFSAANQEIYLRFNHPVANHEKIFSDILDTPELVITYSMPVLLSDWISSCFPGAKRFHITRSLIRSIYTRFKGEKSHDRVFVNIRTSSFDLVVLRKVQIYYCNTFHYEAPSDLLYYLLFVFEQLHLDTDALLLTLLGDADPNSEMYELLSKYVQSIDFLTPHNYFSYSHEIPHTSLHKFYDLLNAAL